MSRKAFYFQYSININNLQRGFPDSPAADWSFKYHEARPSALDHAWRVSCCICQQLLANWSELWYYQCTDEEDYMELFDVAIRMEEEGAKFYRELAQKTTSEGFKSIFTMLAEDEDRHKATFEAMKSNTSIPASTSDASVRATKIFKQFSKDDFLNEEKQLAVYEDALEIELKSIEFYSEQHDLVSDVKQKRALAKIIEEERRHYDLIDDIIVMVERPETWVEHAEFGVRDDY